MQRRQFNAWAALWPWGAASATVAVAGCGGSGDDDGDGSGGAPTGPLEKALPSPGTAPVQVLALRSGDFLAVWTAADTIQWQRFAPDGRALGPVSTGAFWAVMAQALDDGGFAFASGKHPTQILSATLPGGYGVYRYGADGAEQPAIVKTADNATSVAALLPRGGFLTVSVPAHTAFMYNEPAQPTSYAQAQLQRHDSAGQPQGAPLRFAGERGHWFAVAVRPQGGYWLLRTVIASFGAKYTAPYGGQVWLERYDDSDRLQMSTLVMAAADVPDSPVFQGSGAASVQGVSVTSTPGGGAVVHWTGGHSYFGPEPWWNHFARAFDAQGVATGPAVAFLPTAESSSRTTVYLPPPRSDGLVDVLVARTEGNIEPLVMRTTLHTWNLKEGTAVAAPRQVHDSAGVRNALESWKSMDRLRDDSLVILASDLQADAAGELRERLFLRRLSRRGDWLRWAA